MKKRAFPASTNDLRAGSSTLQSSASQIPTVLLGAVVLIAFISIILFFAVSRPTNEYLSLSFTGNDVNDATIIDHIDFSFAVENHYASEKEIPYEITIDQNVIRHGTLTIPSASRAEQAITIPFTKNSFSQRKVSVRLIDQNQEIFFNAGLQVKATFVNNLALVSAHVTPRTYAFSVNPDRNFELSFSWVALKKVDKNYMVFVHVLDADDRIAFQYDHVPFRDGNAAPTATWKPDALISETLREQIPDGISDGTYRIAVGWYLPGAPRVKTKQGADFVLLESISIRNESNTTTDTNSTTLLADTNTPSPQRDTNTIDTNALLTITPPVTPGDAIE